ncbi:MAG: TAXI family TRAP transporter solute-binding subunit [Syntrophales bacterium]
MKNKSYCQISFITCILLCGLCLPGTAFGAKKMLVGATSASSSHYGYFVAVAQVINKNVPDMEASVVETGATADNLRRFSRRQIDIGMITTNTQSEAYNARALYAKNPVKTKILWVYVVAPQNVVVRKDARVTKLSDLNGKRFNAGIKGSSTEQTTHAVFKALKIAPDFVPGSTGDIVTAVKDNRVIGYVKSGAGLMLDASSRDIATLTPIDLLSLDANQAATIAKDFPDLVVIDVPAGVAAKGIGAYKTWGFAVGCAAGLDMDTETAYRIVKAICEDKTQQAAAFADVKGADFMDMTLKYSSSPLHPGAIKYFKERGAVIPDRLIEK